jgi:hypothetical protein
VELRALSPGLPNHMTLTWVMNYWNTSEGSGILFQELHPGKDLLSSWTEGPEPGHSESCDVHSLLLLYKEVTSWVGSESTQ